MKTTVYVGRTERNLVLKYPVGLDNQEICHFYPADEDVSKTAYYLKLEMKGKGLEFKPFNDKPHGINQVDEEYLNKLEKLCAQNN